MEFNTVLPLVAVDAIFNEFHQTSLIGCVVVPASKALRRSLAKHLPRVALALFKQFMDRPHKLNLWKA